MLTESPFLQKFAKEITREVTKEVTQQTTIANTRNLTIELLIARFEPVPEEDLRRMEAITDEQTIKVLLIQAGLATTLDAFRAHLPTP